jgi:hypothetical protein
MKSVSAADLEPATAGVDPGVEPHVDPVADVGEGPHGGPGADREQQAADHQVRRALGRHPEQHHEEGEEQERRAEVALGHHDDQRDAPRQDDRAEVAQLR